MREETNIVFPEVIAVARRPSDPVAADDDTPYKEQAVAAAARFVSALEGKRYSEIWHELVVAETREVWAALVYLRRREAIAQSFGMPVEETTQEFLSHALSNDIDGVRTGLWEGIRESAQQQGWFHREPERVQVAFLNNAALVAIPTKGVQLTLPLLKVHGEGYRVDLETFALASFTLRAQDFLQAAEQANNTGAFSRGIQLLEDALRLKRAHELLRQHAWSQLFTSQRRAELGKDAEFLPRIELLLAENRELVALDVEAALRKAEDESIDFKVLAPPPGDTHTRRDLAKDFAAFSTSGGGKIYFGVTDKTREIVGIEEAKTSQGQEEIRKRIDMMCKDNIKPAIVVKVVFRPYHTSS